MLWRTLSDSTLDQPIVVYAYAGQELLESTDHRLAYKKGGTEELTYRD